MIASVLGSLDDKIELNRQTNNSLHDLLHAWFLARLSDWHRSPLDDVVELNPPRKLRHQSDAPYLDMRNVPTRGPRVVQVIRRPAGSGARFVNGDTLIARITPCLENGKSAFIDFLADREVGWGSTEFIIMRPRDPIPPIYAYLLARWQPLRAHAIAAMTGTSGRQRVPVDALRNFRVPVPPVPASAALESLATPIVRLMKAHDEQNRTLTELRDLLLPKLVSGEIRVKDAEEVVQSVT